MDSYTLAIISILVLAIQALGAHAIFTLYVSESQLRETIKEQGKELIRLRQMLETYSATETAEPDAVRVASSENTACTSEPDAELTLEELIARYERDEEESWRLMNAASPEESTLPRHLHEAATA